MKTRIPRRTLLSGSARLVAASTAAAMLPTQASAAAPPKTRLRHINPPTLATPHGYSHVVDVTGGRTIYISGQAAVDRAGNIVGGGNLKAQSQQVFENLKTALEAAGATFADVVKLTFYMLDASQVQDVRDVRDTFIATNMPPASTLVEVRRLVNKEFLIEIDAIANVAAD
jgi:enamine deaminase RidA (YjgF/YER057c/UK114 family)